MALVPITGGVQLRAPGQVLLEIRPDHARIVLPSAALELGQTVESWSAKWLTWGARVLLGDELRRGVQSWETHGLDVHIDVLGPQIPDSWVVLEDAWTGRSARRRPDPDGYDAQGRLTGWWIGGKADGPRGRKTATALHAYNKTLHLETDPDRRGHGALRAFFEAERQSLAAEGIAHTGPVWRFEAHLQDGALDLHSQSEAWALRDPASWHNPKAIAAALAYVFGSSNERASGVIRLTAEKERAKPAKRRGVHPLWQLLRDAIEGAPAGRIVQARQARTAELGQRLDLAERRIGRALGQLAGVVGEADTPEQARAAADAALPRIYGRDDWGGHVQRGRLDHADLHTDTDTTT